MSYVRPHLPLIAAMTETGTEGTAYPSLYALFLTLRTLDIWLWRGPDGVSADSFCATAARQALQQLPKDHPFYASLAHALNAMQARSTDPEAAAVVPYLGEIADTLRTQRDVDLAAYVAFIVSELADESAQPDLAIHAELTMGFCERERGNLRGAETHYREAKAIAEWAHQHSGVLLARTGLANLLRIHGELTAADAQLERIIGEARRRGLLDVLWGGLDIQSQLARDQHDLERAVVLGGEAFELAPTAAQRQTCLLALSANLIELKRFDGAHDALVCLLAEAPSAILKTAARINLMSVAARRGNACDFLKYRQQVDANALPPRVLCSFALESARGFRMMGNVEAAREALALAHTVGERHDFQTPIQEAAAILAEIDRPMRLLAHRIPSAGVKRVEAVLHERALAVAA